MDRGDARVDVAVPSPDPTTHEGEGELSSPIPGEGEEEREGVGSSRSPRNEGANDDGVDEHDEQDKQDEREGGGSDDEEKGDEDDEEDWGEAYHRGGDMSWILGAEQHEVEATPREIDGVERLQYNVDVDAFLLSSPQIEGETRLIKLLEECSSLIDEKGLSSAILPTIADLRRARQGCMNSTIKLPEAPSLVTQAELLWEEIQCGSIARDDPVYVHELLLEFFRFMAESTLSKKYKYLARWGRFCKESTVSERVGPSFIDRLRRIENEYRYASRRVCRLEETVDACRTPRKEFFSTSDVHTMIRSVVHYEGSRAKARRWMHEAQWLCISCRGNLLRRGAALLRETTLRSDVAKSAPLVLRTEEELDQRLHVILKEFNLSEVDVDDGDALRQKVARVFSTDFVRQAMERKFPAYDCTEQYAKLSEGVKKAATESGKIESSMLADEMTYRKESTWVGWVKFSPRVQAYQKRQSIALKNIHVDVELRSEAGFVDVNDVDFASRRLRTQCEAKGVGMERMTKFAGVDMRSNVALLHASLSATPHNRPRTTGLLRASRDARAAASPSQHVASEGEAVDLPSHKLLCLEYLRLLQVRRAKRRLLGCLNYFRSIQRRLVMDNVAWAHLSKESLKGDDVHESRRPPPPPSSASLFSASSPILPSLHPLYRVPDDYIMNCERLLEATGVENWEDSYEENGDGLIHIRDEAGFRIVYSAALQDLEDLDAHLLRLGSYYTSKPGSKEHDIIDRMGVLVDLYFCEVAFQEAKRKVVDVLLEVYEHVCAPFALQYIVQVIVDTIAQRPRVDLEAPYFGEGYMSETLCQESLATLMSIIARYQVEEELECVRKNCARDDTEESFGFPVPPFEVDQVKKVLLTHKSSSVLGIFDFFPSLDVVARIPDLLACGTHELQRALESPSLLQVVALARALVEEAMNAWDRLHKDKSAVDIRRNVLDDARGLAHLVTQQCQRVEYQEPEWDVLCRALLLVQLRHALDGARLERGILEQTYRSQRGGELWECIQTDSMHRKFAIDDFWNADIGLETTENVKDLLDATGFRKARMTLECEVVQRNALLVAVQYNIVLLDPILRADLLKWESADGGGVFITQPGDDTGEKHTTSTKASSSHTVGPTTRPMLDIDQVRDGIVNWVRTSYSEKSVRLTRIHDRFERSAQITELKQSLVTSYGEKLFMTLFGNSLKVQLIRIMEDMRAICRGTAELPFAILDDPDATENTEKRKASAPLLITDGTPRQDTRNPEEERAELLGQRVHVRDNACIGNLWVVPHSKDIMRMGNVEDVSRRNEILQAALHIAFLLRDMVIFAKLKADLAPGGVDSTGRAISHGTMDVACHELLRLKNEVSNLSDSKSMENVIRYLSERRKIAFHKLSAVLSSCLDRFLAVKSEGAFQMLSKVLHSLNQRPTTPRLCVPLGISQQATTSNGDSLLSRMRRLDANGPFCGAFPETHTDEVVMGIFQLSQADRNYVYGEELKLELLLEELHVEHKVYATGQPEDSALLNESVLTLLHVLRALKRDYCCRVLTIKDLDTPTSLEQANAAYEGRIMSRVHKLKEQVHDAKQRVTTTILAEIKCSWLVPPKKLQVMKADSPMIGVLLQIQVVLADLNRLLLREQVDEVSSSTGRALVSQEDPESTPMCVTEFVEYIKDHIVEPTEEGGHVCLSEEDLSAALTKFTSDFQSLVAQIRKDHAFSSTALDQRRNHLIYTKDRIIRHLQLLREIDRHSWEKRVNTEVIDKGYRLIYEVEDLREQLQVTRASLENQEPRIREDVKREYDNVVMELTSQIVILKSKFNDYRNQVHADMLDNMSEVKRDAFSKITTTNAGTIEVKRNALRNLYAEKDCIKLKEEASELKRALLKLKTMQRLREITIRSAYERKLESMEKQRVDDELAHEERGKFEIQEQALRRQLLTTQNALNESNRKVDGLKLELRVAQRSKQLLAQWKILRAELMSEIEARSRTRPTWGVDVNIVMRELERTNQELEEVLCRTRLTRTGGDALATGPETSPRVIEQTEAETAEVPPDSDLNTARSRYSDTSESRLQINSLLNENQMLRQALMKMGVEVPAALELERGAEIVTPAEALPRRRARTAAQPTTQPLEMPLDDTVNRSLPKPRAPRNTSHTRLTRPQQQQQQQVEQTDLKPSQRMSFTRPTTAFPSVARDLPFDVHERTLRRQYLEKRLHEER